MSQLVYDNFPEQAREGFIADNTQVRDIVSRLAEVVVPFGKFVVASTGQSEDLAKLPTVTGDITTPGLATGIAIADPSVETAKADTFGNYKVNTTIPVMRKGRIWVIAEDEVTDLDADVFVRFADAGGSPPDASLGSFRTDADTADAVQLVKARWRGRTVGTFQLVILEIDL